MIKKKLPVTAEKRPLKQQTPPPVEDEEYETEPEEEEDQGEEETPSRTVKGSTSAKQPAVGAPVGGSSKKSSLAAAYDSVPASNNADNIPQGRYEAIIKSVVIQEPDPKGQSIRMSFELCGPEFENRNQVTTWFKMADADGDPVDGGVRAFKGTLAKLGYEPSSDELPEALEEISNENPGVLLKITYSKDRDGNIWQRATVDSKCDNELIQEYKDNVAY